MRRCTTFLLMGALTVTALVARASFAGAKTLPADAAASPSPSFEPATQVSGTVLGVGGKGSSAWQEPIAGAQIFMTDTSAATPKNVKAN